MTSYDLLNPAIQRWIRDAGWTELRRVQDEAIGAILKTGDDVLVTATTAAGKTEAAFLPLMTLAAARTAPGVSILYVSPLKALINDQFRRLETLADSMEMPVVRWHGDAPQGPKSKMLKNPAGIVLITPESIEALFLRRPHAARALFGALDAILIDELHAFLQGPRGLHLASLLQRIDHVSAIRPRRVALSATIGDPAFAARWLNPEAPGQVALVAPLGTQPELRLQVRGYVEPPGDEALDSLEGDGPPDALSHIADHLFKHLRGTNNLVFAGSRRSVEALADRLRRRSEATNVPNEFLPHHGSLSRELREELETRLKADALPTTAIATTTLELGVDIGSVVSVAQVGAPRSLASLRQRLGRSGRREGVPATLRIYVREQQLVSDSEALDRLRLSTVRSVAAVRLLLLRFVERARSDPSLATVVLHQTLSLIVERGGLSPVQAYRQICKTGPLSQFGAEDYAELLRSVSALAEPLVEQASDGTLMLGPGGEWLTGSRDFYAIFESDEEWRLVASGKALGTIPLSNAIGVGSLIGFAGRRWKVVGLDDRAKVADVVAHPAAMLPKFDRLSREAIDDRLVAEMRIVYESDDVPEYLESTARSFLAEARNAYRALALDRVRIVEEGADVHLLTWRGTELNAVLALLLSAEGLACEAHDVGIAVADCEPARLADCLAGLPIRPSLNDISIRVGSLRVGKYDSFVPDAVLQRLWVARNAHTEDDLEAFLADLKAVPRA